MMEIKDITLRDYFAAQAAGVIAATAYQNVPAAEMWVEQSVKSGKTVAQLMAEDSYELADAMLAEKQKGENRQ